MEKNRLIAVILWYKVLSIEEYYHDMSFRITEPFPENMSSVVENTQSDFLTDNVILGR